MNHLVGILIASTATLITTATASADVPVSPTAAPNQRTDDSIHAVVGADLELSSELGVAGGVNASIRLPRTPVFVYGGIAGGGSLLKISSPQTASEYRAGVEIRDTNRSSLLHGFAGFDIGYYSGTGEDGSSHLRTLLYGPRAGIEIGNTVRLRASAQVSNFEAARPYPFLGQSLNETFSLGVVVPF